MWWKRKQQAKEVPIFAPPSTAPPVRSSPIPKARSLAEEWDELVTRTPETAWAILSSRSIEDLPLAASVKDEPLAEYRRVLRHLGGEFADHVFVGVDAESGRPRLVHRDIFNQHGYILGATGTGKSASLLSTLVLQLGAPPYCSADEMPAVFILDAKIEPDPTLALCASALAESRGTEFQFFSTSTRYKSRSFDPMQGIERLYDPTEISEYLMNTFGLVYQSGYGADFFAGAQRIALNEIAKQGFASYDELVRLIKAKVGEDKRGDSRGLEAALSSLSDAPRIHTDGSPLPADEAVRMDELVETGGVLYAFMDIHSQALLARDVGRLIIFSLIEAVKRLKRKRRCYVFIDEFHNFASRNIINRFKDLRSLKMSLIVSHQHPEDLATHDEGNLFRRVYNEVWFRQALSVEDPTLQELINAGAPERIRWLEAKGHSTSRTQSQTWSEGESHSRSHSEGWGTSAGARGSSVSNNVTSGSTDGVSRNRGGAVGSSESDQQGWRSEYVPFIDGETVMRVKGGKLVSLLDVRDEGRGLTPTHGMPVLVRSFYAFPEGSSPPFEFAAEEGPSIVEKARLKGTAGTKASQNGRRKKKPKKRPEETLFSIPPDPELEALAASLGRHMLRPKKDPHPDRAEGPD